jgi:hypothetical protein
MTKAFDEGCRVATDPSIPLTQIELRLQGGTTAGVWLVDRRGQAEVGSRSMLLREPGGNAADSANWAARAAG